MTNYKERLDKILEGIDKYARIRVVGEPLNEESHIVEIRLRLADAVSEEAKQAILDWHNKQVEKVLDRLESQSRRADECTDDTYVVKMIRVEAERSCLNPSKSTPFNKLKERDDDQI